MFIPVYVGPGSASQGSRNCELRSELWVPEP
jgi:hypothetical protein